MEAPSVETPITVVKRPLNHSETLSAGWRVMGEIRLRLWPCSDSKVRVGREGFRVGVSSVQFNSVKRGALKEGQPTLDITISEVYSGLLGWSRCCGQPYSNDFNLGGSHVCGGERVDVVFAQVAIRSARLLVLDQIS